MTTDQPDDDTADEHDPMTVIRNINGDPVAVVGDGADHMLKPYLDSVAYVTNVRQWAAGLSDGARIDVVSAIFATAPEDWRGLALTHLSEKFAPNPFAKLVKLGKQAKEAHGK